MSLGRFGWAAISLVAIAALALVLVKSVTVKTDLSFFFPKSTSPVVQLIVDRLRDGPASRIILIGISGGPAPALVHASDALRAAMSDSGRFILTSNGRPPAMSEFTALFDYRYLLNPPIRPEDFTIETLRAKLTTALHLLATTLGAQLKQILPADPTMRTLDVLRNLRGMAEGHRVDGVWFTPDGKTALIVAQTKAAPFDFQGQTAVIAWLHQAFAGITDSQRLRLEMTGPSVFTVEAQAVIKSEVQWLNVVAFLAVALLIVVAFRSAYIIFPLMVPLVSGILVGTAVTQAIFGYVHGTSLAFGSTLIGVAIDYPLHLAVHTRKMSDALSAIRKIWPTLRLGAVTTVIAFGSLIFSSFPGLSQLGVIAVAGILTAALMTRWLLPRILSGRAVGKMLVLPLPASGRRGRRYAAVACALAVTVAGGYLVSRADSLWQDDLAGLSPISRAEQQRDRYFRTAIGAADVRRLLVVSGPSAEETLRRSESLAPDLERLVHDGALGGFDMAAKYLPSARSQKARQEIIPPPEALASRLHEALSGLPYKPSYFDAFLHDAAAARSAAPVALGDLKASLLGARIGTLLFESGPSWIGLIAVAGVKEDNGLKAIVQSRAVPWLHYVDLKAVSDGIAADYREEALSWLGGGVVVALLVMLYGLGSVAATLRVALPVLSAIVLTAGLVALVGEPLSIFHIVGLLLVGGLGMDYGLFFNRVDEDIDARRATFTAVALCCATTVTVFGILAVSSLPVLSNIGQTVAIGTSIAFVLCFLLRAAPASD